MNFNFTEEQTLLQETLRRCLAEQADFATRKATLAASTGWSSSLWSTLTELGMPALPLSESDGGLGGGAIELALAAEAAGTALLVEPLVSTLWANAIIDRYGRAPARTAWITALAAGRQMAVPTFESVSDAVVAHRESGGYRLQGSASVVYHAPLATHYVIAATTSVSHVADTLLVVAADTSGVDVARYTTVDDQLAGDVNLHDVFVPEADVLVMNDPEALAWAVDVGLLVVSADALGSAARALALTIEYLKTRQQFGGPIGRFQALQHRVVACLAKLEELKTSVWVAAARFGDEPAARRAALAALKVIASETARHIGEESVQLHGGMGVTQEMEISHHFRRLTAASIRFGARAQHLAAYANLRFGSISPG
jgi:alkylation response protein AidB-like acyl-CoA dehydrogenase